MTNGKAGEDESAADLSEGDQKKKKNEVGQGPETSLRIGRLRRGAETFMRKWFPTDSLSLALPLDLLTQGFCSLGRAQGQMHLRTFL